MELHPADVTVPQPRVNSDNDYTYVPTPDLKRAEAAMTARAQHARPAASPSHKPGTDLLLIGACFCLGLSVLLNVQLLIMRAATHSQSAPSGVDLISAAAQVDLANVARAEAAYRRLSSLYTTDSTALRANGYQPVVSTDVTVYVGSLGASSFCAVAGGAGGARWFLYDSTRGGLTTKTYATEPQAQLACGVPVTLTFAILT